MEEAGLREMISTLGHRGPDGTGFYADDHAGLAHARLAIIDIAGGAQPIRNEDATLWVVFNGEVFNYLELRAELESAGHAFYTQSDTEVLVHLYEEWGERFVERLNGQFAIALWDVRRRRMILARDRVGIAPLYYTCFDGRLWFGSEVKAILAGSRQRPTLDLTALGQIMTFWFTLAPRTPFEGISELPPGHLAVIEGGRIELREYWRWSYPVRGEERRGDPERLAQELREVLSDAVAIRLRAEVPVGAYLSGGLDSSTIVALIRERQIAPLRTFSIALPGDFDESPFQSLMVDPKRGDRHTRISCDGDAIAEAFARTIWHTESPILRTAPAPMGLLSARVREEGYRVVLTGEGADETLGGYDLFKEAKVRHFWARHPGSRWRPLLLRRLYPWLGGKLAGDTYLQSFFGTGLETPEACGFSHLPRWSLTSHCHSFLSPELRGRLPPDPLALVAPLFPEEASEWHPLHRAQFLEAKTLLPGYLLSSQGDRMLLANGVEGRFPFLDHRLIAFANRLDPRLKMRVLQEKFLLRRAMQGQLPETIRQRTKQPYRAPDAAAFFHEGRPHPLVNDLLSSARITDYGYFDPRKVELLIAKLRQGRGGGFRDNMAFVGILSTQLWHRLFVENFAAPARPLFAWADRGDRATGG